MLQGLGHFIPQTNSSNSLVDIRFGPMNPTKAKGYIKGYKVERTVR